MNMCLLEVSLCEKCRSSYFQSEGESKKFEYWGGGLKNFRTVWGLPIWFGVTFAGGGVSTPLHAMRKVGNKSQVLILPVPIPDEERN